MSGSNDFLFAKPNPNTPWRDYNTVYARRSGRPRPAGLWPAVAWFVLRGNAVKSCGRCGSVRPLEEFPRDPRYSDGLSDVCGRCKS